MSSVSERRATARPAEEAPKLPIEKIGWQFLALPFVAFVALPVLALFVRIDPARFLKSLSDRQVLQAIQLSLSTSAITVLLSVVLGTPVAYLLHHRRGGIYRLLDTLVDLPTVLPPAVAGVALLMAFGRGGLLGGWLSSIGVQVPFTPAAVVMAQTFIAAPFYIKSAALGFASVDCELKKAAAMDGATRLGTFRYVMIPMSWHALASGAVMTWARALGEFGATIIFAGNFPGRTQTMPLAIYLGFELDISVALTLSVILICVAFLTLLVVKGLLHDRVNPVEEYD